MYLPVLGCVGTAKNTGKTTALTAILQEARRRGYRVALTSIGYDGEELDNLTGLPKPRVEVHAGDLVGTARPCLEKSPLGWDLLADCGVSTALGPLVVARVTSPGRVILAGPAHRRGLGRLCRLLAARQESDLLLVDGAFGRLSPLGRAQGLVISTGAARSVDPEVLGREVHALTRLFSLPRHRLQGCRLRHLQSEDECRVAAWQLAGGQTVLILGMVTLAGLAWLADMISGMEAGKGWGRLLFAHPVQLLLAGPAERVLEVVYRLESLGPGLAVVGGPAILAVTVNPFYPRLLGPNRFRAARLDASQLKARVAEHVGSQIPVIDVKRDGPEQLGQVVEDWLLGRRPSPT